MTIYIYLFSICLLTPKVVTDCLANTTQEHNSLYTALSNRSGNTLSIRSGNTLSISNGNTLSISSENTQNSTVTFYITHSQKKREMMPVEEKQT